MTDAFRTCTGSPVKDLIVIRDLITITDQDCGRDSSQDRAVAGGCGFGKVVQHSVHHHRTLGEAGKYDLLGGTIPGLSAEHSQSPGHAHIQVGEILVGCMQDRLHAVGNIRHRFRLHRTVRPKISHQPLPGALYGGAEPVRVILGRLPSPVARPRLARPARSHEQDVCTVRGCSRSARRGRVCRYRRVSQCPASR